jgi:hypothetical protein
MVVTWIALQRFVELVADALLSPWDTTRLDQRPPLGSWQRTINDAFEFPPAPMLAGIGILAASVLIFRWRAARTPSGRGLPVLFALTTAAYLVSCLTLIFSGAPIGLLGPRPMDAGPVGFNVPVLSLQGLILGAMLLLQAFYPLPTTSVGAETSEHAVRRSFS